MSLKHPSFYCQENPSSAPTPCEMVVDPQSVVQEPDLYQVVIHNDDYTPMEFVVRILQEIFNKTLDDANKIMLEVHKNGMGLCGVYPYEVAETKVNLVDNTAKSLEYPLKCALEKE
jgi:ATP-dependent Clp protease adaptor protein ClpS